MCTDKENTGGPIIRFQGTPNEPAKEKEKSLLKRFKSLLPHLIKTVALGPRYWKAKVLQEENKAEKIAAEAADIAASTDLKNQQAIAEFSKTVKGVVDDPEVVKKAVLAKIIAKDPEWAEQVDKINNMIEKLEDRRGLSIDVLERHWETDEDNDPDLLNAAVD